MLMYNKRKRRNTGVKNYAKLNLNFVFTFSLNMPQVFFMIAIPFPSVGLLNTHTFASFAFLRVIHNPLGSSKVLYIAETLPLQYLRINEMMQTHRCVLQ